MAMRELRKGQLVRKYTESRVVPAQYILRSECVTWLTALPDVDVSDYPMPFALVDPYMYQPLHTNQEAFMQDTGEEMYDVTMVGAD